MYLKRKIDKKLEGWKKSDNKLPLIIKGARQIGKTESILHFSEKNYKNIIYINFMLEPKYKNLVINGYDVGNICKMITVDNPNIHFVDNNTIIIFDEIQEYPDISTALKSFAIDKKYDVICSGSLLGVHYKKIHSVSVGYKEDYEMQGFDFEEFLWAIGYTENNISDILEKMLNEKVFLEDEKKIWENLFFDFCILGGMPQVISNYIKSNTFDGTLSYQKQIMLDYEDDVRKYHEIVNGERILKVFRNIPTQLAKENKRFQYSKIGNSIRAREYGGCVEWLKDAGIVNMCYCLNFPMIPLKANYNQNIYKIYLQDTGLLISSLEEESADDLRINKNMNVYKGAIYENMAADALYKQGYDLYYYKRPDSMLEEDFFIRDKNVVVPIEVKAGKNKSKSLNELITNDKYEDIIYGIKFCDKNIGFANGIYTFPYFCLFLLKRFMQYKK